MWEPERAPVIFQGTDLQKLAPPGSEVRYTTEPPPIGALVTDSLSVPRTTGLEVPDQTIIEKTGDRVSSIVLYAALPTLSYFVTMLLWIGDAQRRDSGGSSSVLPFIFFPALAVAWPLQLLVSAVSICAPASMTIAAFLRVRPPPGQLYTLESTSACW